MFSLLSNLQRDINQQNQDPYGLERDIDKKKKWNYLIGDVVKLCYSKINSTSIATFTFIDKTTLKIFN